MRRDQLRYELSDEKIAIELKDGDAPVAEIWPGGAHRDDERVGLSELTRRVTLTLRGIEGGGEAAKLAGPIDRSKLGRLFVQPDEASLRGEQEEVGYQLRVLRRRSPYPGLQRQAVGSRPPGTGVDEELDEGALQLAIEVAGDAMRGIVDASLKLVPLRIGDLTEPLVLEGRQEHEKNEQRRCEDGRARFRPQHRAGV